MTRIIGLSETTDPAAVANQAIIYSKDVAGVTHFFARLSDGTIVQLSGATSGGGDRGWYGTGVQGDETTDGAGAGDETWTEDQFFNNYTITAGDTIRTGGNRLYCSGTLTIESGAFLDHSGEDASGRIGGAGAATGTLIGGTAGGNGAQDDGPAAQAGGDSAYWPSKESTPSGGSGGGTGASGGQAYPQFGFGSYMIESIATGNGTGGGAGGGGGGTASGDDGGGAGGGAGVMVICARNIVAASGSIRAKGGAGDDSTGGGAGGGGGGGMGGVIFIVTDDATAPTVDVSGGAFGTGTAGDGTAGSDGVRIAISPVYGPL